MKNILTAAVTAFLVLFASAGCDDKSCDDTAETVAPVDSADVSTAGQDTVAESDVVSSEDAAQSSDAATQTEEDVKSSDSGPDSGEDLPSDATETSESDSE